LAEQLSRSVNDGSLVVALTSSGLTNVTGISVVSLRDDDDDVPVASSQQNVIYSIKCTSLASVRACDFAF
jgi:hypothetical protein